MTTKIPIAQESKAKEQTQREGRTKNRKAPQTLQQGHKKDKADAKGKEDKRQNQKGGTRDGRKEQTGGDSYGLRIRSSK